LALLRGLIVVKRYAGPFLRALSRPFTVVGLFFVRAIGVPLFRFSFFLRRHLLALLRPTKHRLLQVITNRYTIHVVMVVLVAAVVVTNARTREVRAETFGQKSILYALVAVDDSQTLEVVEASDRVVTTGTQISYLTDTVLDTRLHADLDVSDEYATPLTGGETEPAPAPPVREEVETYLVQEGDTLGRIAERYGLNLSTILWANQLTIRSTIRPGQELTILPKDGVVYKVVSGDTISRIARRYDVEADQILDENQLASTDTLQIGQTLLIPGGEPFQAAPRITAPVANLFSPPSKVAPSGGGWLWPTDWRVITQYYGWRHTGVDIDGDYSTFSYAARDGVVIYSGWRGGYGLTIEVDHGDGYVTRYAHHSKNLVARGEVVNAGQALARTGTTGRSTGTHLHFEIIRNSRFQNPLDFVR